MPESQPSQRGKEPKVDLKKRALVGNILKGSAVIATASALGWGILRPGSPEPLPLVSQEPPAPDADYNVEDVTSVRKYIERHVPKKYGSASLLPEFKVNLVDGGPYGEALIQTFTNNYSAIIHEVNLRSRYTNGELISNDHQAGTAWKETILHEIALNDVLNAMKNRKLVFDFNLPIHQQGYLSLVDGLAYLMLPLKHQHMSELTKTENGVKTHIGLSTSENLNQYPSMYQGDMYLQFGQPFTQEHLNALPKLESSGMIVPGISSIMPIVNSALSNGAFQAIGK